MKYALVTVSEHGETVERIFESEIEDLELDPYQNNCPIVVGSNQSIRTIESINKPKINKLAREQFDYDCECGFNICTECGYPYYPMEANEGDTCEECGFGIVVEYNLTLKCS